jgi:N-acetylmuramoyl-L-alanine amidase/putative methionine-R-sulfoxide reductase with GAF domain
LAFSFLRQQAREGAKAATGNGRKPALRLDPSEQVALDDVLSLVAERALTIVKADGIGIALAEDQAIICRAAKGTIAPDVGIRLNPQSGFSGECLVWGQTIRCNDANGDPRVDATACRGLGVRSMIAVPISARKSVIGLIEAFSGRPNAFRDADVERLELLAELILAALKPEEEDRMAEVARQVIPAAAKPQEARVARPEATAALPTEKTVSVVLETPLLGQLDPQAAPRSSSVWLRVAVAGFALGMALGCGAWWKLHQKPVAAASMVPQPIAETAPASTTPASLPEPQAVDDSAIAPQSPAASSAVSQVTGIRHWSSPDSSTVVIDLQDQIQYEAHRLSDPERIYFDLHDTKLAANVPTKPIDINDGLLLRVRAAQQSEAISRIVLETKSTPNFSVSLEENPYRLVIEVRNTAKPDTRTKADLFGPANAPIISNSAPAAGTGSPAVAGAPRVRIALDAGHGGWDLGTVGRKGLLEKDLVLDIVARLGKLVESRLGAEVVYTRKDDSYLPLEKRTETANLAHADLLLSVHANYSDYASARGVETYYTNTYSSVRARPAEGESQAVQNVAWTNVDIRSRVLESKRFASQLQQSLYQTLAAKNPGLRNRGVKEASYVVLTGATMPAVLAEVSFVSSPTDETRLQSETYRQQIAEALYKGIAGYINSTRTQQVAKASSKSSASR